MNNHDGLLVSLRSYRPREGRDSLENFITEAFCWLLRKSEPVSTRFVQYIDDCLSEDRKLPALDEPMRWSTQYALGLQRPDMVAEWSGGLLMFEHKVGLELHESQLSSYRKLAERHRAGVATRMIAVTRSLRPRSDVADVHLCWRDIYGLVSQAVDTGMQDTDRAYANEFLALLAHEGLGPRRPVDLDAVLHYPVARNLPGQLETVFGQLADDWRLPDYEAAKLDTRWGRLGLLFERDDKRLKWGPSIFVGCLLDGKDHGVDERLSEIVKLQVILSFSKKLHGKYGTFASYQGLKQELAAKLEGTRWELYDHGSAEVSPGKRNKYHQLYIEVPLFKVLRNGAADFDEQKESIRAACQEALDLLQSAESFELLKTECSRAAAVDATSLA